MPAPTIAGPDRRPYSRARPRSPPHHDPASVGLASAWRTSLVRQSSIRSAPRRGTHDEFSLNRAWYQVKLWKRELQRFANETGLKITVNHCRLAPAGLGQYHAVGSANPPVAVGKCDPLQPRPSVDGEVFRGEGAGQATNTGDSGGRSLLPPVSLPCSALVFGSGSSSYCIYLCNLGIATRAGHTKAVDGLRLLRCCLRRIRGSRTSKQRKEAGEVSVIPPRALELAAQ